MGKQFKLTRTGDAPLTFNGELVAEATTERFAGREQNRWFELNLYRTTGGRYVLAVTYRTLWQGEVDRHHVEAIDPAGVALALRTLDPCEWVQGFPQGNDHSGHYAKKQESLLAHIRRQYAHAVSELLGQVEELAERIE